MAEQAETGQHLYILSVVLFALVVITSLAVAYSGYQNRQVFIELKQASQRQIELQINHGRLLLEKSTWSSPAVIEEAAASRLGMQLPLPEQTVIVHARAVPLAEKFLMTGSGG